MIKTIEQAFEEYARLSGNNCCAEHKAAARLIFFCGVSSSWSFNQEAAALPTYEEKTQAIKARHEELKRFVAEIKAERERQREAGEVVTWPKAWTHELGQTTGRN